MNVVDFISQKRLVAVIRLPDLSTATALSRALIAGGVCALEFTLTNRDSIDVIRRLRDELPEVANGEAVIGAGTVTSVEDARLSMQAGAQFIVSPTTKVSVIDACKEGGVPIMPGAYTPTEIEAAWDAGADVVKVFPATTLGPGYIKAVLAPLPHLKLLPTGGIDHTNMADYLNSGVIAVGVGGNLLDKKAIAAGDWEAIQATAQQYAHLATR
ncbi:MAG: bifunctional 4-hydroxy-2-oxoglutarate aldolase/2-dehydro-3-deoxy-phosphogluconate aldolase [Anaerolineae bacterium]